MGCVHVSLLTAIMVLCMGAIAPTPAMAEAVSRQVASRCLQLAYKAFPYQRPGKAAGNGARYEFFKACVAKGGQIEPLQTEGERSKS